MALTSTKPPIVCAPRHDVARRQHHHDRHADGEDHGLAGIQHRERGVGLRRGALVALHRAVVARRLARLGAEILHRLVIEERVDRLGVGVRVGLVHPAADRDPPLRRLVGVGEIDDDHRRGRPPSRASRTGRRGCRSRARTRRSSARAAARTGATIPRCRCARARARGSGRRSCARDGSAGDRRCMCSKVCSASRRTACIATLAKSPSRTCVRSAMATRETP